MQGNFERPYLSENPYEEDQIEVATEEANQARQCGHGTVGIWHETYRVHQGDYENVYVNMPAFGVGKVGQLEPAHAHAHDRMRGRAAPADAQER